MATTVEDKAIIRQLCFCRGIACSYCGGYAWACRGGVSYQCRACMEERVVRITSLDRHAQ